MNGTDSQTFGRRRPKPRFKRLKRCQDCTRPISTFGRVVQRHPFCKECRRDHRETADLLSTFPRSTLRGF